MAPSPNNSLYYRYRDRLSRRPQSGPIRRRAFQPTTSAASPARGGLAPTSASSRRSRRRSMRASRARRSEMSSRGLFAGLTGSTAKRSWSISWPSMRRASPYQTSFVRVTDQPSRRAAVVIATFTPPAPGRGGQTRLTSALASSTETESSERISDLSDCLCSTFLATGFDGRKGRGACLGKIGVAVRQAPRCGGQIPPHSKRKRRLRKLRRHDDVCRSRPSAKPARSASA